MPGCILFLWIWKYLTDFICAEFVQGWQIWSWGHDLSFPLHLPGLIIHHHGLWCIFSLSFVTCLECLLNRCFEIIQSKYVQLGMSWDTVNAVDWAYNIDVFTEKINTVLLGHTKMLLFQSDININEGWRRSRILQNVWYTIHIFFIGPIHHCTLGPLHVAAGRTETAAMVVCRVWLFILVECIVVIIRFLLTLFKEGSG